MFAVVFEVRPAEGRKQAYLGLAREMKLVLDAIDGFLDNERFESRTRPGWVLSLSTWRDEKAVIRWRTHARHHLTQEKGRSGIFSDYHLRVGEITADTDPPADLPVQEQRFDATETGTAKTLTVTELTPEPGAEIGSGLGLGLDENTAGLLGREVFESLVAPGRLAVLAAWTGPEAAAACQPEPPAGTRALRHRAVRVIRGYGMHDRREAPQHFPAPAGHGSP